VSAAVTSGGLDEAANSRVLAEERARVVAAFSKAASELGYRGLDMERVARYAGIPLERCQEYFVTKEQGLVAAQDAFLDRLWSEVISVRGAAGTWPDGVRSAIHAVLEIVVEASPLARVFMVEATAASMAAAERQYAFLGRLADLLLRGRVFYPRAALLPAATERLLVGGMASIVGEHLLAEEPAALAALEPQLVEALLMPYLGSAEARRQARRPD
jgi:AcrR family transcriptional regulator